MVAGFQVVDVSNGRVCQSECLLSRQQLMDALDISRSTLDRYIGILLKHCSRQFSYVSRQKVFLPNQINAITYLNNLFKQDFLEQQVIDILIRNGIPTPEPQNQKSA